MRSRNEAVIVLLLICSLIAFGLGTGVGITTGINGNSQTVHQIAVNGGNNTTAGDINSSDELNGQNVQLSNSG